MRKTRVWLCMFTLVGATCAFGDKVYLKNGRKLAGTAKRHKDGVDLITEDGKQLSFAKGDVKRVVFESTATPKELLEMLDELEDLIARPMGLGQPEQREFGKVTIKRRARVPFGERPGRYTDRDTTRERGLARENVGTDKFVDDWIRFAAHFEAVAKTRSYKNHMRAVRRKKSLAEFARYPPEVLEELGSVLAEMIEAVKETFELAQRANSALAASRLEALRRDRLIASAANRARRASVSRSESGERSALARAHVQELRDDKVVKMKEMRLGADNAVNRVAASRIIAIRQLDESRNMLEQHIHGSQRQPPTGP